MSSSRDGAAPRRATEDAEPDDLDELLAVDDAAEEIVAADDVAMVSDDDDVALQDDLVARFDLPRDSLFAIAQHPRSLALIAIGGSAAPADDAPGAAWLLDAAPCRPLLPPSYVADAGAAPPPSQLRSLAALDGHSDSVSALCWSLPRGDVLLSADLDGRLRAWRTRVPDAVASAVAVSLLAEAREVDEINWLAPCPAPAHPGAVALGAADGSVWVYQVDAAAAADALRIVRSYFLHTAPCTAGAWTPDGQLLASVSEDGSLYVWDVWGVAAAAGHVTDDGMAAVALTTADQRFAVDGGLFSLAVDPRGAFVAGGGAGGAVKVVSLPRLGPGPSAPAPGGKLLASLHAQRDSVETLAAVSLAATTPPTTLLAAGSVDGSIAVYDAGRRFAVRRHIPAAHADHAVVRLDFVPGSWLLTSCGMDGVVRRWDLRADAPRPLREWKGHRGGGEGGGVLGFVQGPAGDSIVTAGDDGLALVFEA